MSGKRDGNADIGITTRLHPLGVLVTVEESLRNQTRSPEAENVDRTGKHRPHRPMRRQYRLTLYGAGSALIVGGIVFAAVTGLSDRDRWAVAATLLALGLGIALPTAIVSSDVVEAVDGLYIRRRILALDAAYLIILTLALFLYLLYTNVTGGPLTPLKSIQNIDFALEAIWFAELGSVAASLKGIADRRNSAQWDEGWRLWYWSRPANGLIVGLVTYFVLGILLTQNAPSFAGIAVVSFLFGMQEVRFFTFLSKAATMFLSTEGDKSGLTITSVEPKVGTEGTIVVITGANIAPGTVATIGGRDLGQLRISADGTAVAGIVPAEIPETPDHKHDVLLAAPGGPAFRLADAFTYGNPADNG